MCGHDKGINFCSGGTQSGYTYVDNARSGEHSLQRQPTSYLSEDTYLIFRGEKLPKLSTNASTEKYLKELCHGHAWNQRRFSRPAMDFSTCSYTYTVTSYLYHISRYVTTLFFDQQIGYYPHSSTAHRTHYLKGFSPRVNRTKNNITAITTNTWINPPTVYEVTKPRSQRTMRTHAIVVIILFYSRAFIYARVNIPQFPVAGIPTLA
ncbi:MAG: hypothetical protein RLZZ347_482 [Candidatus Parcubacteria bacterium]|jgi:hypothetical protein